jgi:DNA-binding NarL/FixJ family response regulator
MARARVLLADDHDALLDKVGWLLDGEFDVIGKVGDGQALLDAAERLKPDLLIMDISMPVMGGIEAAHRLIESGSNARIIFLTVHEDPEFIREAFAAGASGYVIKSRIASDLIVAAREVLGGRSFTSPSSSATKE